MFFQGVDQDSLENKLWIHFQQILNKCFDESDSVHA